MRILLFLSCLMIFIRSYSQSYISKAKALEDIDYMNQTIQKVHVNPFLFINEKKYFSEVNSFKNSIKDSIEIKGLVRLLYKMTALLKDGHTAPFLAQSAFLNSLQQEIFFPYALITADTSLLVPKSTSTLAGIPTGARVISINHKKVKSLLAEMTKYPGGTKEHAKEMQNKLFSYFLFLNSLSAPFTIVYKDASNKQHQKVIEKGVNFKDALSVTMPHFKNSYSFKILDNKLGYFDFRNMSVDINELDKYLDSCITAQKITTSHISLLTFAKTVVATL